MDEKRRLSRIEKRLYDEVYGSHDLLRRGGTPDLGRPILAELALCASKAGMPDRDRLETIGVSLELMRLAVQRHYEAVPRDGNFNLITADFYYARAISLASNLPCPRAVTSLSKAIVEIASAEASFALATDYGIEEARKRAGLFAAAGELGGYLAGLDAARVKILSEFGRQTGVAFLAASGTLPKSLVHKLGRLDRLIKEAVSVLEGPIESIAAASLAEYAKVISAGGVGLSARADRADVRTEDLAVSTD